MFNDSSRGESCFLQEQNCNWMHREKTNEDHGDISATDTINTESY